MKIAVLADIHANAQALRAVIEDANVQKADRFIVAGDIISDGPSPREVLQIVRGLTGEVIKGNREDYMLKYRSGEFKGWQGRKQVATLLWTYNSLSGDDLDYIAGLPEQLTVNLGGASVRMVHGSPFSMYELLKPFEDMAAVERAALAVSEQALVFGHYHMQWTGTVCGRLLINPGSVGVHFNSEAKAEYGILTFDEGNLSAELRRVPYDFTALEKELDASGLASASPVWTRITFEGVKAGRNYCLEFLDDAKHIMGEEGIAEGLIPNDVWDKAGRKWRTEKGWGGLT